MMRQVPARYKVKGTVSNKALYYMKDLAPRTVLMSDDTGLSDSIQEILKSATSNFHEPITPYDGDKGPRLTGLHDPRAVRLVDRKEGRDR